jgi:hypothetical protein
MVGAPDRVAGEDRAVRDRRRAHAGFGNHPRHAVRAPGPRAPTRPEKPRPQEESCSCDTPKDRRHFNGGAAPRLPGAARTCGLVNRRHFSKAKGSSGPHRFPCPTANVNDPSGNSRRLGGDRKNRRSSCCLFSGRPRRGREMGNHARSSSICALAAALGGCSTSTYESNLAFDLTQRSYATDREGESRRGELHGGRAYPHCSELVVC